MEQSSIATPTKPLTVLQAFAINSSDRSEMLRSETRAVFETDCQLLSAQLALAESVTEKSKQMEIVNAAINAFLQRTWRILIFVAREHNATHRFFINEQIDALLAKNLSFKTKNLVCSRVESLLLGGCKECKAATMPTNNEALQAMFTTFVFLKQKLEGDNALLTELWNQFTKLIDEMIQQNPINARIVLNEVDEIVEGHTEEMQRVLEFIQGETPARLKVLFRVHGF